MGQASPVNGATTTGVSKPQSTSTVSSVPPTQLAKDYDFSSFTQGMFAKQLVAFGVTMLCFAILIQK